MSNAGIPLVSIICLTYQHAKFIRETLEGFVSQKTDFPFEILIYDDASTDGTQDVIREYADRYPELFVKVELAKENLFQKTGTYGTIAMLPQGRGKYYATCDGDDCWTDCRKLQKQVNFLEAHPDYSICFHRVRIEENGVMTDRTIPSPGELRAAKRDGGFNAYSLLRTYFMQTSSVLFRWAREYPAFQGQYPSKIMSGDNLAYFLHALKGKIGFIDEVMGTYRLHASGITAQKGVYGCKMWQSFLRQHVRLCAYLLPYTTEGTKENGELWRGLNWSLGTLIRYALRYHEFPLLQDLRGEFPQYWDGAVQEIIPEWCCDSRFHRLIAVGGRFFWCAARKGMRQALNEWRKIAWDKIREKI